MWKRWCNHHKTWTSDYWKYVIWSDESSFTLFLMSGTVYVYRMHKETYNPECLVLAIIHGSGSVMVWAATSWYSAVRVITLNGWITASDYMDILGNQMHPMVQMLYPNNDAVFQDDSSPIHTAKVFSLGLRRMKINFSVIPGQHSHHT